MNSPQKQQLLRLVVAAIVLAAAMIILRLTPVGIWLKPDLRSLQEQLGDFAPLAYIIIYILATVLAIPGTILTLSAGAVFGPVFGTVWTVIGATLGANAAFLISRFVAGSWAKRQFEKGDSLRRLRVGIAENGFWFVLSLRLIPIFPFNAVNYLLGLTPISLSNYFLATFVGIIPGSFAYAWLGRGGLEAATGGAPWQLVGALTVLALLSALPFVLKWLRRDI